MTALLGAHSLSKSYGTQSLFEGLSFTFCVGDKIGLLGPNGAGKSTLLKILAGIESPDSGHISKRQGLIIGYASQLPEFPQMSVQDVLLQAMLVGDEFELLTKARKILSKAQFTDFSVNAMSLSGGWKKRLDICKALMQEPDLLILDEPTNHLDLEGIKWLEMLLARERISYIVVSHDRYFLENVSNKVIEINRCFPGGLFISEGNMTTFMEHKRAFLDGQVQQERGLASVVREEVEWLKRSPKARTTKSRSRIDKANELIEELSQLKQRNKTRTVDLDFTSSQRETRKLLTSKNLSKSLGGKELFKGIDLTLSPKTRLGIVGKNGTGKTTLLKILARQIPQDMGTLKVADDLKLVYFDQHREHIPSHFTLREALSPVGDQVNYRGQYIHVNGWAKKFLFSPDRLELPVGCLSGGERARILIARLMLEPADILFLDEPTNDLDIPTLEVIEESLNEFQGAVVLISHDRCLMDRVCTQILALGNESNERFFADYNQWEKACAQNETKRTQEKSSKILENTKKPKKLSYKDQKELDGMEDAIMKIEIEIDNLQKQLEDPSMHENPIHSLDLYRLLSEAQQKHEYLFDRWQYLLNL